MSVEKIIEKIQEKPENLPNKFWNDEQKEIRISELIQSYLALEKKLGAQKFQTAPFVNEEYELQLKDDLIAIDPAVNARLKEKGFTNAQAQEVYDLAIDILKPLLIELVASYKADREAEKLVNHFGGFENWTQISKQLKKFGEKNLPNAAFEGLASSYEGILALHAMMQRDIQDGITVSGRNVGQGQVTDINAMMKNPKYCREKDAAYIAKVTKAFEDAYN